MANQMERQAGMRLTIQVTAAVMRREDGRVLLARRNPGRAFAGLWEFPGGKIEPDETPEGCLERELYEEFGIECAIGAYIGSSRVENPGVIVELHAYETRHISGEFTPADHDAIAWVTLDELGEYAMPEADVPIVRCLLETSSSPSEHPATADAVPGGKKHNQEHTSGRGRSLGHFFAWWRGDPLPRLEPVPGLAVEQGTAVSLLARMARLEEREIRRRLEQGNEPFVARLGGTAVAYGWMATRLAAIPQIELSFDLPNGEVYLWDFATLPPWRGRGMYPHLLQAITLEGAPYISRFWVGHEPGNDASGRGLRKAGFLHVGELFAADDGTRRLMAGGSLERAQAIAALAGVGVTGRV
jgi:mutator protein MutT